MKGRHLEDNNVVQPHTCITNVDDSHNIVEVVMIARDNM
jgi:hypothetical protein